MTSLPTCNLPYTGETRLPIPQDLMAGMVAAMEKRDAGGMFQPVCAVPEDQMEPGVYRGPVMDRS